VILASLALCAPTLDLTNQAAVQEAAKRIANNLIGYYLKPGASSQGTINPSTAQDASGFQWYEGGIMWGVMMEYMKTTGDLTHITSSVNAMTLGSFGTVGSFLGTDEVLAITLEGKWNDDILWWGLGPIVGAEMFGANQNMPGGVSYVQLSNKTFAQVQAQNDPTCQGGIWWSRDRANPRFKNYKSTITQCQQMVLGARLAIITGNPQFANDVAQLNDWMKRAGIITSDFRVNDGVDAGQNCGVNVNQLSYKSGFCSGGLAWLYQATRNQAFIDDANRIFTTATRTFAPNDVITDQCETGDRCPQNQVSPKGTMVRGWGYLHEFTNSPEIRSRLKTILRTSVQAMLATCDNNYNCGNNWSGRTFTSSNVHFQMNSLELITSYLKTFTDGPVGRQYNGAPNQAPPSQQAPPPKGSAFSNTASLFQYAVTFALLLL